MFVIRSSDEGHEKVVLRYAAVFYWLMWPIMAITTWASIRPSASTIVVTICAWVVLVAAAAPYWPVTFELKRQMTVGSITASGSKYSFSNPLTYQWTKVDISGQDKERETDTAKSIDNRCGIKPSDQLDNNSSRE